MDSKFLEKPRIQQNLPDRETRNNLIADQPSPGSTVSWRKDPQSLLPGTSISQTVDLLKTGVEEASQLLEDIRKTTRSITARCTASWDTSLSEALSLPEVKEIATTGLMTYAQLTALRETPFQEEARNAWEEYHSGMEGSLEAELEPICESVLQSMCNFAVAMSDSTLYNIPWNGSLDRLSEFELQIRQDLADNMARQLQACANGDTGSYTSLKEQADLLEATIRHRNDLSGTIHGMAQRYRDLVSDMRDAIRAEERNNSITLDQQAITSLLDSSGLPIPTVKLLLYESFNRKRMQLKALKNGPGQTVTFSAKAGITRDLIRKTRVHLDTALPARSLLTHRMLLSDLGSFAAYELLEGVEAAQENYRGAMSQFLGMASTEVEVLKKQLSLIYSKDKTRTMYKR